MRLPIVLFAGAMFAVANQPAQAADRTPLPSGWMVLAQSDDAPPPACPEGEECPCPEGQECPPPVEEQPATEPPPAETPPAEQPADETPPAEEQPAAETPPAEEQPAAETPPAEEQPAAETPPAEEQPAAETPPAEEQPAAQTPPAGEQPQQPCDPTDDPNCPPEQTEQAAPQEPAPEQQQAEPPAAEQPAAETTAVEEEDTTVEQLEAQGDEEEAENVRNLREELMQQLLQATTPPEQQTQSPGPRDRRNWRQYRGEGGGEVVEESGGTIIIDLGGGNIYVEPEVPDDGGRLLYEAEDVEVQNLPGGRTRTIVYRRNGVQIVTVRDRYGDIIRRTKILPDGTEIVLIDARFDDIDNAPPQYIVDIPPPQVQIPQNQYIVDLSGASQNQIYSTLTAPPVQQLNRTFTLQEVLRNEEVRAYAPRLDLDTITFDFGSATIGVDQMPTLYNLGIVMEEIIRQNPEEMYLIEGHTDLVGSDYDNLLLSYRRAEAVAVALSQNFDIPPENLITEGYGEQFPKVLTEAPERRNRRAAVVRITEFLQAAN